MIESNISVFSYKYNTDDKLTLIFYGTAFSGRGLAPMGAQKLDNYFEVNLDLEQISDRIIFVYVGCDSVSLLLESGVVMYYGQIHRSIKLELPIIKIYEYNYNLIFIDAENKIFYWHQRKSHTEPTIFKDIHISVAKMSYSHIVSTSGTLYKYALTNNEFELSEIDYPVKIKSIFASSLKLLNNHNKICNIIDDKIEIDNTFDFDVKYFATYNRSTVVCDVADKLYLLVDNVCHAQTRFWNSVIIGLKFNNDGPIIITTDNIYLCCVDGTDIVVKFVVDNFDLKPVIKKSSRSII